MPPLLEAKNIRKAFPGVVALDNVSVQVHAGEVLAVVGENGAGKSTLMKIMAGIYTPDAGELYFQGQPVQFHNVNDAMNRGISLIHQELNLAENLGATANIFLGREKTKFGAILDRQAMTEQAKKLLERVGLPPDLANVPVYHLAPGQKQLVEIARALSLDAKMIVMDEPTSSLTQKETDRLYTVIDDLKRSGVSVIYISHRLVEVKRCADRVVVLRDGKNAGELNREQIDREAMIRLMVGRELKGIYPRSAREMVSGPPALEVENLTYSKGPSRGVSFSVRGGEIVGMAGLVGAGRTELAEAIFGIRTCTGGTVKISGRPITISQPRDAIEHGILMAPEDRRHNGLVLQESVLANLALPNLKKWHWLGLRNFAKEKKEAQLQVEKLRVKTSSLSKEVGLLSGGNQQKIVLGKWLALGPKVLILDEPTRGVDIGARGEIYALMDALAAQGVAILMISSDMEEILGLSDRVLVLHEGHLTGELNRDQLSEERIMALATGGPIDLA